MWLSNKMLVDEDVGGTGTWLDAMAKALAGSHEVVLGNLTIGKKSVLERNDYDSIEQWMLPSEAKAGRSGLPAKNYVDTIIDIHQRFNPDIVHVWGTEGYWGLLTGRRLITTPTILETQGLRFTVAEVYHGGLNARQQLGCVGIREILRGTTIFQQRQNHERWGTYEKEMIFRARFISTQSDWLEAQVKSVGGKAKLFRTDCMLRDSFYDASPWKYSGSKAIFCSSAYGAPFKGLHVAVRAVAQLARSCPDVELHIAGRAPRPGIRKDGYLRWVERLIDSLGIASNIKWLGPLSAPQIVSELQKCAAMVVPSFVESYCLGLAEAMMIGTPSVVSYAGGLPCLAERQEGALFFPPGDDKMCAYLLECIMNDPSRSTRISENARGIALRRNSRERILGKQLEIYRHVLSG